MDTKIYFLIACFLLLLLLILAVVLLVRKRSSIDYSDLEKEISRIQMQNERNFSSFRNETLGQINTVSQMSLSSISHASSETARELENIRATLNQQLAEMRSENEQSLNSIRGVVGENLQKSVSDSVTGSFETVSIQLKEVSNSIGEIRSLATNVDDLKKVLSGVKTRGIWGEVQLEAIISDLLPASSYKIQMPIGNSDERVDFAIRLPGDNDNPIFLPVDSKFPMDRYQAVLEAENGNDSVQKAVARESLIKSIFSEAKSIASKYIYPPVTTDFAVLFVPSEGLYSYLLSQNLLEPLQKKLHILLAGPSVFSALLNSLLLGYKSIAFENRSSELLKQLEEIKHSFGSLEENLQKLAHSLNGADSHFKKALQCEQRISKLLDFQSADIPFES